ncbi:TPA: ATP-binding protein, partial [Enterobacter kobei]
AFKQYEGCLFIIATHSPQLISKLPEKNSFIYNLAKEVLSTSNGFSHRSSDYQLANIFNSPGVNNEYLSRILITWLVKFSKNESPSDSEKTEIKEVLKLKKLLSDSDPVKRLMLMVEDTMGSI